MVTLQAAIGLTPQTRALREGRVPSRLLRLAFADLPSIVHAFRPMVRELRFDVSEMAIATFLQARAAGVGLTLLPVTLTARFQEPGLLCRADSGIHGPEDLVGRRVGVRAYGQTTALWLRGALGGHGVDAGGIRWVTFEEAHVAGIVDPPWSERARPGSDMLAMLRDGALDAAIFGSERPAGADLRTVFPDPAAEAAAFRARHGFVPINHVLTVRRDLAERRPGLVAELVRMFAAAGAEAPGLPMGRAAMQPAVELALQYAAAQGLLPGPFTADHVWDGCPPGLETLT